MTEPYICDYIRTPIGRFGGSLSSIRADDLGAIPLKALMAKYNGFDWSACRCCWLACPTAFRARR